MPEKYEKKMLDDKTDHKNKKSSSILKVTAFLMFLHCLSIHCKINKEIEDSLQAP